MRKVMGAGSLKVAAQLLWEAVLLALLTLPFTLLLLWWALPHFNALMDIRLEWQAFNQISIGLALAGVTVGVGLLAGLLPSVLFARRNILGLFAPKAATGQSDSRLSLRKGLVTFQFALLMGLGCMTLWVHLQMQYVAAKDLGYAKTGILYVMRDPSTRHAMAEELLKLPAVLRVGAGTELGINPYNQVTYRLQGTDQVFDDATELYMDREAALAFGLQFTPSSVLDDPANQPSQLVMVNQTAAQRFQQAYQVPATEVTGSVLVTEPKYTQEDGTVGFPVTISGVFEDIHLFSLRQGLEPYFLHIYQDMPFTPMAIIQYDPKQASTLLQDIERVYHEVGNVVPFSYDFQEDNLVALYERENRITTLITYLSEVAFGLAILGLLALTTYMTTLRRKEIGIRKVLGATVATLLRSFNRGYFSLLLVGMLVGVPLAYWSTHQWLQNFAYRIAVPWWTVLVVAILTGLVVVASVSLAAYRSATVNPAHTLRDDQ
ncbi:MAG: FtsX-like permease family protein [Bacteroidota bacterium]